MATFIKSNTVRMHKGHRKLWNRGFLAFGVWVSWEKHLFPIHIHKAIAQQNGSTYYSR